MMHPDATYARISSLRESGSRRAAMALLLIGLLTATSLAATRSWDGGGRRDHSWTNAENWVGDSLPGAGDAALFDRGAAVSYYVDFPTLFPFGGDINTARLLIGSNTVTFQPDRSNTAYNVAGDIQIGFQQDDVAVLNMNLRNMTANTVLIGYFNDTANGTLNIANNDQLTVTGSAAFNEELVLGSDGKGTLNISSGGKVILTGAAGDIKLGTYNGAGKVAITGAGSTLSTAAGIWVGENGTGTIDVMAGGQLNSGTSYIGDYPNETGEVTVDGIGSAWTNSGAIFVGGSGRGVLQITSGGTVVFGESNLGEFASSTGIVHVDGAQSTWTSGDLYVGNNGLGGVQIAGGGQVTSLSARVGVDSTGNGLVTVGPGSTWKANQIIVGEFGQGFVDVLGGGQVNSGTLDVARGRFEVSGAGEVRIDGQDSEWICSSNARIGSTYGEGLLEITNSGKLRSKDGSIGATVGMINGTGTATLSGAGSLWSLTGDLNIGLGLNGAGSLTLATSGTVDVGGLLKVGPTGEVQGDGNIIANVQNGGLVSPGTSPGALNIHGDYTQTAGGKLLVELASASSYDKLLAADNAVLAGTLDVALLDGFMPTVGNLFEVLHADGGIFNTFANTTLPTLAPNLDWRIIYSNFAVLLQVISTLPGDYNADGSVDAADYLVWRKNDSTPAGYDTWRANFGATAAVGAASRRAAPGPPRLGGPTPAVPEPASLWIALPCIAVLLQLRHTYSKCAH
jgi:T5SS/PEP-CTERM-associated repeat protein